jgi:hypothetical protein
MKEIKGISFYVTVETDREQEIAERLLFKNGANWEFVEKGKIIILRDNYLYFDGEHLWHVYIKKMNIDKRYIFTLQGLKTFLNENVQIEFDF